MYSRSEGNALYAEEILAAGPDGRGSLPPTLRDALMLRVERLSPRAQELIRWLACQPAADHVLVVAVAGLDPADLRDALREAVASHIVVTVGDESYGFRHALLREVVYDDLLPGERTEMHAALAGALEERIEGGERGAHITAQVAYHWAAAGNQPRTLAAAARAGLAAERVNAFAEAQALSSARSRSGSGCRTPRTRRDRRVRAPAPRRRGRGSGGRADASGGPASARAPAGGRRGRSRPRRAIQERLSQSLWSQHRQDDSLEALREGLALLPDEPSAERAKLLAQFSRRRMVQSRFAEAAESAREALSVARAVGYREAEAIALNALGTALGESGDVDPGVAYLRESLEIAREDGLEMEESGAWINISDVLNLAGRTEEALEAALQGLETAYTHDWRTTDWLKLSISEFRFHLGDWDGAAEAIPPSSRRHTGGTRLYWLTCLAQLALGRGDVDAAGDAIATLAKATADLTEPQFVGMHGVLSAELSRRRGDIDAARAVIDDALDRIEFCSEDVVRVAALAVMGLRVEGDAGEAARDRRDEEAERVVRDSSRRSARTVAAGGRGGSRCRGRAARHLRGRVCTRHRWRRPGPLGDRGRALGRAQAPLYRPRTRAGARPRHGWQAATARAHRGLRRRRWPARAGSAARGLPRRSSRWPHGRGFSSERARRLRPRPLARRATTPSA